MNKSWLYWAMALSIIFCTCSCSPKKKDDHIKKAAAFKELGVAYMKDDMDAAAYKNLRKAESLNPKDPHIHFALGVFYFKKENILTTSKVGCFSSIVSSVFLASVN